MIKIYGAAHQLPDWKLIDFDGEVTRKDLELIVSKPLSWDRMDLKSKEESEEECECNWVVEWDGVEHRCETNFTFQTLVQSILREVR